MTYQQSLLTERWKTKRLKLIIAARFECQDCARSFPSEKKLEVHHCWYEYGKEAWDYPDDCFLVLCRKCHKKRQKVQNSAQVVLGMYMRLLAVEQIEALVFELVAKRQDITRQVEVEL